MWTISSTSQTCRWACEAFHHCVYVWLGLITTRYNKSMSWSWVRRLKSPCDCHQCIHFTVQTLFASSCHWECCEYLYSPWMYLIIFCFFCFNFWNVNVDIFWCVLFEEFKNVSTKLDKGKCFITVMFLISCYNFCCAYFGKIWTSDVYFWMLPCRLRCVSIDVVLGQSLVKRIAVYTHPCKYLLDIW